MKIFSVDSTNFKGQRQDRKTVEQLKQDNKYSLNIINQRRINQAIDNLAKISDKDNVEFLIDVSKNLKYGTNIDLGKKPYNNWHAKLNKAIEISLVSLPLEVKKDLTEKVQKLSEIKPLTETEEEIIRLRSSLLEKVDLKELEKIPTKNIRNLGSNLDYFIISSEVPNTQKLYILKRLNYFMSDEYHINEQLQDKKTQALAEIVNDIVIDTPESKIPNIKAVDQGQHGMCAAISICRKNLAYEDKANYVDIILSELDNSPDMMVYDITKLGSGTKIPIPKISIDFDYALSQGYRIIDTSALYWMNIADTDFSNNNPVGVYNPFDKQFFDTFKDSHLMPNISDEMTNNHDYFRALIKSKDILESYKKRMIVKDYEKNINEQTKQEKLETIKQYNKRISHLIQEISPNIDVIKRQQIISDLKNLEIKNSDKASQINDYRKSFIFLPNESFDMKLEKMKAFLSIALPDKNNKTFNKNSQEIADLVLQTTKLADDISGHSSRTKELNRAKLLYKAAAAYRTQMIMKLYIPDLMEEMLNIYEIPDRESRISDNMKSLIKKLEIASMSEDELRENNITKTQLQKAKLSPELIQGLANNFQTEADPEILKIALEENLKTLDYIMTDLMDEFYKASLYVDRRKVLENNLKAMHDAIIDKDEEILTALAKDLQMEPDAKEILLVLDSFIKMLEDKNCTNETYIRIFNALGYKNQMQEFVEDFQNLYEALFVNKKPNIIAGFNLMNGLESNAPIEETLKAYNLIGENFNKVSAMTTALQNALEVKSKNGEILNTVIDKEILIKLMEDSGKIVSEKHLRHFQNKFSKISNVLKNYNGKAVKFKDLPKELKQFSPEEKVILKQIEQNINSWYKETTRALNLQYRAIEEPLSELYRDIGVRTGHKYVKSEGDSGLRGRQMAKIIEHMTDRPYYIEENTKLALNKIKSMPYSGISSTSVDDKSPAYHAQYITDIKSVTTKDIDGKIHEKEALFHDNSWGPVEHENVWTDSNGLLRTDYAQDMGGAFGYITGEKYNSGQFLDNIVGQYGTYTPKNIDSKQYRRITGSKFGDGYKYPMFSDVILSGKSPEVDEYVKSIHSNIFISPYKFFGDFEKLTKNMSYQEVKQVINTVETLSDKVYEDYDIFKKRIMGTPPFDKGIKTQKDYDKLSDSDPLKIVLEQIAIQESYRDIDNSKLYHSKHSMKELNNIRNSIRKVARENFDYTFGKTPEITNIVTSENIEDKLTEIIKNFTDENQIKLAKSKINSIINSTKKVDKKRFDGSLYNTTVLISESFAQYLDTKTPDFHGKKEKIKAIKENVQQYLYNEMIFNIEDLKSPAFKTAKLSKVTAWIDRNFKPKTDEEFVEIFKNLQNMTSKEFNEKFNSTITDYDMNIKNSSGFDIIKRIRLGDENTERKLLNTIYTREIGSQLKLTKTKALYEYGKYSKVLRGHFYSNRKRTFDDLYYDYHWELYSLGVQNIYPKLRKAFFKNYDLFPAYPVLEYENMDEVTKIFQNFIEEVNETIEIIDAQKDLESTIYLAKDLQKYISRFKDSSVLSQKQKEKINEKLEQFIKINGEDDDSIKDTIAAIHNLLALPENAKAIDYKNQIKIIYDEISMYATDATGKSSQEAIVTRVKELKSTKDDFIKHNFGLKYQPKAYRAINKYIRAKMNHSDESDEVLLYEFTDLYDKYRNNRHPEQVLNDYLYMVAKSKTGEANKATKENIDKLKEKIKTLSQSDKSKAKTEIKKLQKELDELEQKYSIISMLKENIEGMLVCANTLELEKILMDCIKDANINLVRDEFKKSKITLKDGKVIEIDSEKAMNIILMPFILGEQESTALKFIEEFGLEETAVKMIINSSRPDNVRKLIIRMGNILEAASKQHQYIQEELDKLGNLDNDPLYAEKLDKAMKNIMRKINTSGYKKSNKVIKEMYSRIQEVIEENPNLSKTAFAYLLMEGAKQNITKLALQETSVMNEHLTKFQTIANCVKKIELPNGSDVQKQKDEFLKTLDDLVELSSQNAKEYPELGIGVSNIPQE